MTPFCYFRLFIVNNSTMKTTQKKMKIILNEEQVKRLLDTITKESVLEESNKQNTLKLIKSV